MKRLLMIAFHFPPLAGSSGIQRTLRFAKYLPKYGWEPLILTAHERAYERVSQDQMNEVASTTVVERAFALDTARHLAVRGRYPGFAARPDRWVSWWLGAVPAGLAMIRKYRPSALWSTYPIATAHMIGHSLQRLSGLPWIADFRDPMAQDGYPADPLTWRRFKTIEERALRKASCNVFVTAGAVRFYQKRYPDLPQERFAVIENGYDEEVFESLDTTKEPRTSGILTLLHSGIVYPSERDPTQFFQALRNMLDNGSLQPTELRVRFRAAGHEAFLNRLADKCQVSELVELAPSIPYRDALKEMMSADGLLVLQASNCNDQIPAKLYEYLRCGRPIIALTDPDGDTADLMRRAGMTSIARLNSAAEIASELRQFLDAVKSRAAPKPDRPMVEAASRMHRTRELADVLDRVACSP